MSKERYTAMVEYKNGNFFIGVKDEKNGSPDNFVFLDDAGNAPEGAELNERSYVIAVIDLKKGDVFKKNDSDIFPPCFE